MLWKEQVRDQNVVLHHPPNLKGAEHTDLSKPSADRTLRGAMMGMVGAG